MRFDPRRDSAVEVRHEGRWLPGSLLHAYRHDDGRWRGIVRYTADVGEQYEQGRDQDDIRRPGEAHRQLLPARPPGSTPVTRGWSAP